jgi:hypothetical protein
VPVSFVGGEKWSTPRKATLVHCPKGQIKKGQKEKQRSTKHTYKTKDRVTRIPFKTGVNSTYIVNCHTINYNKIRGY